MTHPLPNREEEEKEKEHGGSLGPSLPPVAVVVLAWNHWELTKHCLESLRRASYPNYEIILVDNGSTDGTVRLAHRDFPEVTVLASERNRGFAAGINLGLGYALDKDYKYVLVLNNDTTIEANLLQTLVTVAEADHSIGMITPKICDANDPSRLWSIGSRRRPLTLAAVDFGVNSIDPTLAEKPREVDYVIACAALIRVEALRQVGLFDERFFMYYEDFDLSIRFQQAGYRLYYVPWTTVLHWGSASTSDVPARRYYHLARSSVYFFAKHGQGRYWLLVPYRLGSAVKTVGKLLIRGRWEAARAYIKGLGEGLRDLR